MSELNERQVCGAVTAACHDACALLLYGKMRSNPDRMERSMCCSARYQMRLGYLFSAGPITCRGCVGITFVCYKAGQLRHFHHGILHRKDEIMHWHQQSHTRLAAR